jgi:ssDNA-binding Zn-finger/Zn-ribbon topoisomerase 1
MGKTVTALRILTCPKCGKRGQLQRYRRIHQWYYRVTHYRGNKITLEDTHWKTSEFEGEYDYCCYIGKNGTLTMNKESEHNNITRTNLKKCSFMQKVKF